MLNNSDSDDGESLISPCLPIDPNAKFCEAPTNGHEYLLTVMKERQTCASVTKCNRDLSVFANKQSVFAEELPNLKPVPFALRPTIEWQNIQVADFSDIRMYVSRMLSQNTQLPKTETKMPLVSSRQNWENFCKSQSPDLSYVLTLKQAMLENVLAGLVSCIDETPHGETIDVDFGRWIYAILACIEMPCLSETLSLLRELARKCANIRSRINPEVDNAVQLVSPCNLFICLVSKYFGQMDLSV